MSTKRVAFALRPTEDLQSNNETGKDKYPKSDKAHAPNSNAEREEKQLEGCEKDPKPVTPKPGAAQLWLAGLKTKEEGEKKKKKSNKIKSAMALLRT